MLPRDFRLGFVSARSAYLGKNGPKKDQLWTDAGLGRLIDELKKRVPHLKVALSSIPSPPPLFDHRLSLDTNDFLALPFLPSVRGGLPKSLACRRVLRRLEEQSDALLVQLPFAATPALLRPRRPRLYHLCADVLKQTQTSPYYRGLRRAPALAVAHGVDRLQRHLVHRPGSRTVTHGADLRRHYGEPPGRWVVSSTLLEEEIASVPRRRPEDAPLRVLFVGYLRHEKGFDVLLAAFRELLRQHPDAEMEIVGAMDYKDSGVDDQLRQGLASLDAGGRVRLLGPRGFGPELFQRFADADVLVLPSRSEGTPRVLVEARAFGCPVIASRVGGIPSSVDHGVDGLLFPPGDQEALARLLIRFADEPQLRESLRERGLERARRHTVEAFADELVAELGLLLSAAQS
ncbi:MAG: glycosyltransferase family 4 protein [Acidobacteriota bacterium]|nr:glycosyltransferase family 4 protein [Acidobacteriota bacterium]